MIAYKIKRNLSAVHFSCLFLILMINFQAIINTFQLNNHGVISKL